MQRLFLLLLLSAQWVLAQGSSKPFGDEMPKSNAITVTIGGAFVVNGSFSASPLERVDQFVTRIYALNRNSVRSQNAEPAVDDYARRNIRLKRITGGEMILDLDMFRLTGDFRNNPFLKNDDLLVFPTRDLDRDFISVSGAVHRVGKFQFVEGDRLSDAVLLAGGLDESYDSICCATLSRLDMSGQHERLSSLRLDENPYLKRGDRIIINAGDNQLRDYRLYVSGEVSLPGSVPISRSSTTLREVVKRVGGFKPSADLNRTELIRGANVFQSLFFNEQFERLLMSRTADIPDEDSTSFLVDNKLRIARGNGLINFADVLSDSSRDGDFIVRDGDFIFVPERTNLVYVFGQVSNPGYVEYSLNQHADYYVRKAGGTTLTAREKVYLIKGKSRTWQEIGTDDGISIEPGDFVWVPKEHPRDLNYYLVRVGSFAQIVAALATVLLLVRQF